jgi:hypothetical protein
VFNQGVLMTVLEELLQLEITILVSSLLGVFSSVLLTVLRRKITFLQDFNLLLFVIADSSSLLNQLQQFNLSLLLHQLQLQLHHKCLHLLYSLALLVNDLFSLQTLIPLADEHLNIFIPSTLFG